MDDRQQFISELITPSPVSPKNYQRIASQYTARGEPVPPGVAMLAAAELLRIPNKSIRPE